MMKLKLAKLFESSKSFSNLSCYKFSSSIAKSKKSFLLGKNSSKGDSTFSKKVEVRTIDITDENFNKLEEEKGTKKIQPSQQNKSISKKAKSEDTHIKENYACVYYKFPIEKEFNLFHLRNLLYSYIFARQRNGKIYLNFSDTTFDDKELKNKQFEELMKILDWLDISLDFDDKVKNKLFESQRIDDYTKWLSFLLGQKDAYKCFCKSYQKCTGNCYDSRENMDHINIETRNNGIAPRLFNPDVIYVRFKNTSASYSYFDYMNNEVKEFSGDSQGDFLIYKNFNGQFLDSFKRVVDDNIYGVTHLIEEKKAFNPLKNAILTKHLLFNEKNYIELPEIKIKYWNKEDYEKIDLSYLKSRFLIPEAILNEALMLGYSKKPTKEFKELLLNNRDKDVADWNRVIWEFDITNISKMGSVFDFRRLLYLNKRNLIRKFIKTHESFKGPIFEEFKQTFKTIFHKHTARMENWDHEDWRKMIYLITSNIISYEDMYSFYFLFEPPIISAITKENKKTIKGFLLDEDYKKYIIKEVNKLFLKMDKFDAKNINKEISYFIFKRYQKDKNIKNVNFYPFLKLIITGYADAPNLGEICEFVGKKAVLERIKSTYKLNKSSIVENVKLLQEKKQNAISLLSAAEQEPKLIDGISKSELQRI